MKHSVLIRITAKLHILGQAKPFYGFWTWPSSLVWSLFGPGDNMQNPIRDNSLSISLFIILILRRNAVNSHDRVHGCVLPFSILSSVFAFNFCLVSSLVKHTRFCCLSLIFRSVRFIYRVQLLYPPLICSIFVWFDWNHILPISISAFKHSASLRWVLSISYQCLETVPGQPGALDSLWAPDRSTINRFEFLCRFLLTLNHRSKRLPQPNTDNPFPDCLDRTAEP